MSFMNNNQPTAAILIIGNEILSGRTQDVNVQFIAKKLSDMGIVLSESCIIQDNQSQIIEFVNRLRGKYTYVFTTGGIGPTHDDITAESVARAFGVKLERNDEAVEMIKIHLEKKNKVIYENSFATAQIPMGAKLIKNSLSGAPGFNIENVYVLAGIPSIVESMFEDVEKKLKRGEKFISRSVKVFVGESIIKDILKTTQEEYDDLQLGSYPMMENEKWCTIMVIRGQRESKIENAVLELKGKLKDNNIEFSEV